MKRPSQAILAAAVAIVTAALLHGCAELPANAPIDDRTAPKQSKKPPEPAPAPASDPPGYYTVRKGDTLSRIAYQFGQTWRDLVDWNGLANPNDIKVGQQLRVVPPEGARVASVPDSGMEVRALDSNAPPASQSTPAPRLPGGLKSGPLGNKLPYSEQAWADMQRADLNPPRVQDIRKSETAPPAAQTPAAPVPVRFIWPTEGKLLNGFDAARKGIDIAGQMGQPIVSVGDGTVLYAKNMRGYGNLVIIDHQEGVVSAYAHNKTILVREGQTVSRGQQIAEMGNTDTDAVKLHFEIRQLGKPVDPTGFLPGR